MDLCIARPPCTVVAGSEVQTVGGDTLADQLTNACERIGAASTAATLRDMWAWAFDESDGYVDTLLRDDHNSRPLLAMAKSCQRLLNTVLGVLSSKACSTIPPAHRVWSVHTLEATGYPALGLWVEWRHSEYGHTTFRLRISRRLCAVVESYDATLFTTGENATRTHVDLVRITEGGGDAFNRELIFHVADNKLWDGGVQH